MHNAVSSPPGDASSLQMWIATSRQSCTDPISCAIEPRSTCCGTDRASFAVSTASYLSHREHLAVSSALSRSRCKHLDTAPVNLSKGSMYLRYPFL